MDISNIKYKEQIGYKEFRLLTKLKKQMTKQINQKYQFLR